MTQITNFAEIHKVLNKYIPKQSKPFKYSLESMQNLMAELGNPQNKLKVIHVAGTSGKTSTCYYIASLLTEAGQKVGLTVSPYVDEVNERVQINLEPLTETEFAKELTEFITIVKKTKIKPTYFELLVAMAYWYFAKQKVDYAVIEVGLGGLLDGTNVINREDKICVITDIGLDHTEVLGNTHSKIAYQKAGIIQAHNPIFMYTQSSEVMGAVKATAKQKHSQLYEIYEPKIVKFPQNLPPFQQRNWYLAKLVYEFITERDKLPKLNVDQLLDSTKIIVPARMEAVSYKGKTIIIDGSHNGQKMEALVNGIQELYPDQPVAALIGFVESEKSRMEDALKQLRKLTDSLIITSFSGEQDTPKHSIETNKIADVSKKLGFNDIGAEENPQKAFSKLIKRPESILLVTGSFYLLNHIRPIIRTTNG